MAPMSAPVSMMAVTTRLILLPAADALTLCLNPPGTRQLALVGSGQASPEAIGALNSAYGVQFDPDGTASIAAQHRPVTAPAG